jgi:nuclear cap-binding protein subunit 1
MGDYDRRQSGGGHGGYNNNRKRRYRGEQLTLAEQRQLSTDARAAPVPAAKLTAFVPTDDDDYDRRPQRRRPDHAPVSVRIRKQLLNLAESPLRRSFVDLALQLAVEQPLRSPFVAAVVVFANTLKPELVDDVLGRVAPVVQTKIGEGEWRDVKLYLKFLACLQSCLSGDGVFPILEDLFNRAVVLQTEDSVDVSCHGSAGLCPQREERVADI